MNIPVTKPFFDTSEIQNVQRVLNSGWVAQGPMTEEFERKIAKHEGAKYAVATSSCTTALHLALLAYKIGKGNDVIVPSFTFVATANAVEYTGATPMLVDIDLDTFNLSVKSLEKVLSIKYQWDEDKQILKNLDTGNQLKAIMVVHQFGLCANMAEINLIAKKYHLIVIEDSACALGAKANGITQGGFGNISCVSFHPRKCITTGEGGMIFTNSKDIYIELKELRSHGASSSEISRHKEQGGFLLPSYPNVGYNFRLSDIQSAIGLAQAEKLDYILAERRKLANRYRKLMQNIPSIVLPIEPTGYFHTYQSYVCLLKKGEMTVEIGNLLRNRILSRLEKEGIQTRQGTHAVHMIEYYVNTYGYKKEDFINAYQADQLSISLPLYVNMKNEEQNIVVEKLKEAFLEEKKNV